MNNLSIINMTALSESVNTESTEKIQEDEPYTLPKWVTVVLLVLYSAIVVASVGGNVVICMLVLMRKNLKSVGNYFVVSLAFSDVIMVILCVPFTVLTNLLYFHWIFGAILCPTVGYLQLSSVIQRSFVLVAAAADRHHAISKPLNKHLSKTGAMVLIATIWVMSLLIPLPIAMYSKLVNMGTNGSEALCIEGWPSNKSRVLYGIAMMAITYVVPLIVIFFTNAHIVAILGRKPPGENVPMRDSRRLCNKKKTTKVMIYVVMAYLVCWLPIHLITIIGDMNPNIYNSKAVHVLWLFSHWLAMSNSASNSVIYFCTDTIYRKSIIDILRRRSSLQAVSDNISPIMARMRTRLNSVGSMSLTKILKRRETEIIDINKITTASSRLRANETFV